MAGESAYLSCELNRQVKPLMVEPHHLRARISFRAGLRCPTCTAGHAHVAQKNSLGLQGMLGHSVQHMMGKPLLVRGLLTCPFSIWIQWVDTMASYKIKPLQALQD